MLQKVLFVFLSFIRLNKRKLILSCVSYRAQVSFAESVMSFKKTIVSAFLVLEFVLQASVIAANAKDSFLRCLKYFKTLF